MLDLNPQTRLAHIPLVERPDRAFV